jgi:hypothetical protein
MTGERYTSYAGPRGPANIGLSPERIQKFNQQARERIAAATADQKAEEEAHKATRTQQGGDIICE